MFKSAKEANEISLESRQSLINKESDCIRWDIHGKVDEYIQLGLLSCVVDLSKYSYYSIKPIVGELEKSGYYCSLNIGNLLCISWDIELSLNINKE